MGVQGSNVDGAQNRKILARMAQLATGLVVSACDTLSGNEFQEPILEEPEPSFVEDKTAVLEVTPEIERALKQVASGHAANFGRTFPVDVARRALADGKPHWFRDLLSLWRPSGYPSGADGLRLAVRNGYLNFYRRGQSVARVSAPGGVLRAEMHIKYFASGVAGLKDQAYGTLVGNTVATRGGVSAPYKGIATLREWIAVIDARYVGVEKALVDELVGINGNVIDLEMGLPAWGSQKTAPRMDLVTIDKQRVVFWEAKTVTDGRIRCRAPYDADKRPEVLHQLSKYRKFLEQDRHVELVEQAYRSAAAILTALRELADDAGPTFELGSEIQHATTAPKLGVAPCAALVVLDETHNEGRAWRSWKQGGHEAKLAGKIPMLVQEVPGPLSYEAAI